MFFAHLKSEWPMELDEFDNEVLRILSENSRLSIRKIAKRTGKSPATIISRIKELEKNGAIKKYSAIFDYSALGFGLSAVIKIDVSKGKLFEVEKKIAGHPNVCAVYDVTGPTDIIAVARFRTTKALDNFLKKVQAYDFVKKTETSIILNTIKEENVKF